MKSIGFSVILCCLAIPPAHSRMQPAVVRQQVEAVATLVAKTRGQAPKEKVKSSVSSKENLTQYMRKMIAEKFTQEQLDMDAWSLVALKMMKTPINSLKLAEDFASDQVAGFYDPKTKTMFVSDWVTPDMLFPVLAHELTHWLQDQQVDLDAFVDPKGEMTGPIHFFSTELVQARHALVEGEALFIMAKAMEAQINAPGKLTSSDDVSFFFPDLDQEEIRIAKKLNVPKQLVESTLFAYVGGFAFSRALFNRGGTELIRWSYSCSPETSAEILWPEVYLSRVFKSEKRVCQPASKAVIDSNFEKMVQTFKKPLSRWMRTDMGALGTKLFFDYHLPDSKQEWIRHLKRDALYLALYPMPIRNAGFVWQLEFDTEEAARTAAFAFELATKKAFLSAETAQKSTFQTLSGRSLRVIWALPEPWLASLRQATVN